MAKIQKVLLVFGLVTLSAHTETLVRKQSLEVRFDGMEHHAAQQTIEADTGGSAESSDHSVDSTHHLSPSLVQKSVEADSVGNIDISNHSVNSTPQLSQGLVRKSVEVDAVGNIKTVGHSVDSMRQLSQRLVRKGNQDVSRTPEVLEQVPADGRVESSDGLVNDGREETSDDVNAAVELGSSAEFQKYGPYPLQRNMLDYFKHWSNGNIAQQLKTRKSYNGGVQASLQEETYEQLRSASGLLGLIQTTSKRTCVKSSRTFDGDAKLYNSTGDPDGVFHALLVLPGGALQYAAVFRGTVMAAEPSLCQIARKDDDLDDGDGAGDVASSTDNLTEEPETGATHMLDIASDPTVQECRDLFNRTVQQQCNTSFEFDVISAREHVIDRIEVEMSFKVTEGTSEYFHTVSCDFEVPWDDNSNQRVDQKGLVATLLFQGSVCEANQRSTSSETDSVKLMHRYSWGEIALPIISGLDDALPRRRRRRRRRRAPPPQDCFPSAAKVYAKDYGHVRIDSLQNGDLILSADAFGRTFYDEVSFYSLADHKRKIEAFLAVGTSTNRVIRMTGAHHLPVGPDCCGNLAIAKELRIGDLVWIVSPGDQIAKLDTVKFIEMVVDDGMHSPVMLKGGNPIVDGVVTSFDDVGSINLATRWMPFLTKVCTAANMCGATATMIKKYECFAKGECGHREVIEATTKGAQVTMQAKHEDLVV